MDDSFHCLLLMVKLLEEALPELLQTQQTCAALAGSAFSWELEFWSQVNKDHWGPYSQKKYLQYIKTEIYAGGGKGEINTHIQCNYSNFFLHGTIFSPSAFSPEVKDGFSCSENWQQQKWVCTDVYFCAMLNSKRAELTGSDTHVHGNPFIFAAKPRESDI